MSDMGNSLTLADDVGEAYGITEVRRQERALLYVEDNPANLKLVEQLNARHPDGCDQRQCNTPRYRERS